MPNDKKVLIMTGWGLPVYPAAAALVLRCVFDMKAEVRGVSQRRLAEELSASIGRYDQIYILGIGLEANPEETAKALLSLRANNSEVFWISGLPMPEGVKEAYRTRGGESCFAKIYEVGNRDLFSAVCRAFPQRVSSDERTFFKRYAVPNPSKGSDQFRYRERFMAADWRHKTFRECDDYALAIRDLAERVRPAAFPSQVNERIEYYRRWGKRELIGESKHIKDVRKIVQLAAKYDNVKARILITGPSGTGKETVAWQIHMLTAKRCSGPFITFNCACTTKELLESRLFGYAPGAYTGALKEGRAGIFEEAEEGTLFLDEVGELSPEAQAQLLRVLQDGDFQRLGSPEVRHVKNVRVIAATNRSLPQMVREGKFRKDLYFRLNVIEIRMEGLASHKEDIAPIARNLWFNLTHESLARDQIRALEKYDYRFNNVRELENMLEYAMAMEISDFDMLREKWIEKVGEIQSVGDDGSPANVGLPRPRDLGWVNSEGDETIDAVIRQYVRFVHDRYPGKTRKEIARILGVCENTYDRYLKTQK